MIASDGFGSVVLFFGFLAMALFGACLAYMRFATWAESQEAKNNRLLAENRGLRAANDELTRMWRRAQSDAYEANRRTFEATEILTDKLSQERDLRNYYLNLWLTAKGHL